MSERIQEIKQRTPPTERHTAFSQMVEPCKSVHKPNGQSLHICCAEIAKYIEQADADRRYLLSLLDSKAPTISEACNVSVTGKHRIDAPYCKDCGREFPLIAAASVGKEAGEQRSFGITPEVARKLILIREALAHDNTPDAWHHLYTIANPEFDLLQPWSELEKIAATSPVPVAELEEQPAYRCDCGMPDCLTCYGGRS